MKRRKVGGHHCDRRSPWVTVRPRQVSVCNKYRGDPGRATGGGAAPSVPIGSGFPSSSPSSFRCRFSDNRAEGETDAPPAVARSEATDNFDNERSHPRHPVLISTANAELSGGIPFAEMTRYVSLFSRGKGGVEEDTGQLAETGDPRGAGG